MTDINNAEEQLAALIKQGAAIMVDAAKIDAQISQLKKSVTETITKSPAPPARASRSPTREPTTPAPPLRTASSSPPSSRTASSSPTARQTSRSPSPEKRPKYCLKPPSGYKLKTGQPEEMQTTPANSTSTGKKTPTPSPRECCCSTLYSQVRNSRA
jgi:hypothetical protein